MTANVEKRSVSALSRGSARRLRVCARWAGRTLTRTGAFLLLLPAIGVAVLPLIYIVQRAFQDGFSTVGEILLRPRTLELAGNTALLVGAVVVSCLILGVGCAWAVTRAGLPAPRVWMVLLTMPLAIPSYVAGLAWISTFPELAGFPGAWCVLTLSNTPLVFLPSVAAFHSWGSDVEDVARSLGRGPVSTFFSVTLPRIWPAAVGGALLVALYVLHDFGAVGLMRYETFTRGIYSAYSAINLTVPAVLGLLLACVAFLIVVGTARLRKASPSQVGAGSAPPSRAHHLGRRRYLVVAALTSFVLLSVGAPLWMLGERMITTVGFESSLSEVFSATLTTVAFAALGAVAVGVIAFPVGWVAARGRRGMRGIETLTYLGHALPGVTVGLALVVFGVAVLGPSYQQTPVILFLAYAALFLPMAVGTIRTHIAATSPQLEEVAHSLGHKRRGVFARVVLPLASPGVLAGVSLVFLAIMKELPATLLLQPPGVETAATRLWAYSSELDYASATPFALVLILLSAVPAWLLQGVVGTGRGGTSP